MTFDISQLPAPQVITAVNYDTELAAMLADLQAKAPDLSLLPSDPAYKILEVCAYKLALKEVEFNDRAKGLLLAFAQGGDLDHLGVTYYQTERLLIDGGDSTAIPPIPPTYESDADYLQRILLAEDGYSTAGPEAAYVYHASSASGNIKDVSVVSPTFERQTADPSWVAAGLPENAVVFVPTDDCGLTDPTPTSVIVTVLSRLGDGTPDQVLLDAVTAALNGDVRPITDEVIVRGATIIPYTINTTLTFYADANQILTLAAAKAALLDYVNSTHALGYAPTELGVRSALKVAGVYDVALNKVVATDMTTSLVVPKTAAAYCISDPIVNAGGTVND